MQSQDPVDPEERTSVNLVEEFPGILEGKGQGDPEGNFLSKLIQSTIQEPNFERFCKKLQIPLEFKLEILLWY